MNAMGCGKNMSWPVSEIRLDIRKNLIEHANGYQFTSGQFEIPNNFVCQKAHYTSFHFDRYAFSSSFFSTNILSGSRLVLLVPVAARSKA
jgi:hypothetical protein